MTSDINLNGNVQDLPADFFDETPQEPVLPPPSAPSGNVTDLPSNFFEPLQADPEVIHRQDTDSVLSAPSGLNGEQIQYLDDTQNNGVLKDQFFGFSKIFQRAEDVAMIPINAVGTLFKGALGTGVDIGGSMEAASRLRTADAIREGLKYDVQVLRKKAARGESLTEEESAVLSRDIANANFPFSFLFRSTDEIIEDKARRNRDDPQAVAELTARADALENSARTIRESTNRIIQEYFPKPDDTVGGIIYDIGGVGTTISASIGLAVLTKNPIASAALFSEIQKDQVYLEARDSEMGPQKARAVSDLAGKVEGALEFVGVNYFFKIAQHSSGVRSVLFRMGEEAIQEFSQQLGEEVITQSTGVRAVDPVAGAQRVGYSMFLGAIGGGAGVSVHALSEMGKKKNQEEKLNIPDKVIESMAQKVTENAPIMLETLSKEIEKDNSPLKDNADSFDRVRKILDDFVQGRPVDVSNLTDQELKFLNNARDESKVIQGLREIDAQQGTNFLPVPRKPQTLSQFLKEQGGLKIDTGEARRFTRKETPNLKGVANKNGKLSLDEARALAAEQGFITDTKYEGGVSISTEQDLLDALEAEAAGGDVVRQKDLTALEQHYQIVDFNDYQDRLNSEIASNSSKISTFKQAFRKGAAAARQDAKATQEALIGAIEQSGLEAADRAKFTRQIKNIQTAEQLAKAVPKIERRIVNLLENNVRRNTKAQIKKSLKATKPLKTGGKPVGKFGDAGIQATLDRLREIGLMTREEAQAQLVKNSDIIQEMQGFPGPELVLENSLLAIMADSPHTPVQEMQRTLAEIQALMRGGRDLAHENKLARAAAMQEVRDVLVDSVTGGRDVKEISQTDIKDNLLKWLNEARAFENALSNAWYDTLDVMFGRTKDGRALRDDLSRGVHKALQHEKALNIEYGQKFVNIAQEVFGTGRGKTMQKFVQDEKVEKLKNSNGDVYMFQREGENKARPWEISRAQARKLWMEFQDETLVETLIDENGNGITPEMRSILFEEFLTPEDIQFAQRQLELYKELYPAVNDVYSKIYGIHLPNNESYSPIRRRHKQQIGDADEFLTELKERQSTTPGFAKSRVSTTAEILPQSDVSAMMRHIGQASHFISMAETARDLQSIFGDTRLREAIDKTWGKNAQETIDNYIQDFTAGSIKRAEGFWKIIDKFNSNFAVSVLALKPNLWAKQMTSFIAYASDIPTVHFVNGVIDFAKNPKKAIKTLNQGALMQARGANQDVEVAKGAQREAKALIKGKAKLDDVLLTFVKLGDRGAIYMGGWSVYKYNRDVLGKSHEEALTAFEEQTARTQQSSDLDQLSRFQANRNPISRTFAMFMTSPNAYYRASKRAIRQGVRGEISVAEMSKRLMIYNAFLPVLFQYVSSAFKWEEDKQEIALLAGWLKGLFIVGPLWEKGIAYYKGVYYNNSGSPNFLSGAEGFRDAITKGIKNGEIELQDLLEAMGEISGTPVKQVYNIGGGIEDIEQGDTGKGVLRFLGYTENQASGDSGSKRKKKKSAF